MSVLIGVKQDIGMYSCRDKMQMRFAIQDQIQHVFVF